MVPRAELPAGCKVALQGGGPRAGTAGRGISRGEDVPVGAVQPMGVREAAVTQRKECTGDDKVGPQK